MRRRRVGRVVGKGVSRIRSKIETIRPLQEFVQLNSKKGVGAEPEPAAVSVCVVSCCCRGR